MRGLLLVAALATLFPWTTSTTAQTSDKDKSDKDKSDKDKSDKDKSDKDKSDKDKKVYITEIGGKTLEQWIKEIPAADRSKGENAIQNVLLFGPERASAALPVILVEMGKHRPGFPIDLSIRVNGAIAAGMLVGGTKEPDPKDVKEAVRLLTAGLSDTQAILRYRCAEALGRIGPEARSAISALLAAVQDGTTWEVREAATIALGRVAYNRKEGPSKLVLGRLYYALGDKASEVRLSAIRSLAMLGAPNDAEFKNSYIRELDKTAKDADPRIVIWGQMTIMGVQNEFPDDRIKIIGKMLAHPEAATRIQAAQAIGTLGNRAKSQVPALIKGLKDRTPEAAGWCVLALSSMGPSARGAVPALQETTKDMQLPEPLRKAAAEAIDTIQGKANKGEK